MDEKCEKEDMLKYHDKEIEKMKSKLEGAVVDIRIIATEQHQFNQKLQEHKEQLSRIEAQNNALFEIAGSMKEMKENQEQFHIETKEEIKEIKDNVNDKMDKVLDKVKENEETVKSYEMKGFNSFKKISGKLIESIIQIFGVVLAVGVLFAIYKAIEFYLFKM